MLPLYLFTYFLVIFGYMETVKAKSPGSKAMITNNGLKYVKEKSPGFKTRITSNGFNYANRVAMDTLVANIRTFSVPDQHGESGSFQYDLTNLRVTGFTEPQSSILILPGAGLKWTANGAGVSMHGNFRYTFRKRWLPTIRGSGTFDISVYGLDFSINMIFGVDVNGRPTIAASGCSCGIYRVKIKFHGRWAWLYNLFSRLVENRVRKILINKICDIVTKQINEDMEKKLASLPVTIKIFGHFLLDYRLLQVPTFQSSYMETFHKGEISWLGDEREAPFQPHTLADIGDTQKMMYLWISDYMFNTLGYAAQMHNYLVLNITAADLPPNQRGILNTTCTSFLCFGNLIPQLQKNFPNSTVELNLFSGRPPTMNITPGELKVNCSGKIVLYARQNDKNRTYVMSTMATMETTVNVSVSNERVHGKINGIMLLLNVTDSAVGPINSRFIQILINSVLKAVLIPKINEFGNKGFPLPVTGKIRFVNTSLRLLKHTMVIETDLKYMG
uniref:Bactericidal/permeability-increasing protein 1 n=1 Tax=Sinohyriopsis cumingii TaxID=165450 RepID=A0A1Z1G770_SINCU|nr:bactericidal/permeability-increasing protein 1 [Sinohyriopsis cumingii]